MSQNKDRFNLTALGTLWHRAKAKISGHTDEGDEYGSPDICDLWNENGCIDISKAQQRMHLKYKILDKFQVATTRMIDTTHGFFSGNHATTVFDNARAVCALTTDLAKDLQRRGFLPPDLTFFYSSKITNIEKDNYAYAKQASNFAKHADKDANETHPYDGNGVENLLLIMAEDYETLHSALVKASLLVCDHERLYKADRDISMNHYKSLYDPTSKLMKKLNPVKVVDEVPFYALSREQILEMEKKHIHVPAAAAACMIYKKYYYFSNRTKENSAKAMKTKQKLAKKMESLGIWPVDIGTNAMLIRHRDIIKREYHYDVPSDMDASPDIAAPSENQP